MDVCLSVDVYCLSFLTLSPSGDVGDDMTMSVLLNVCLLVFIVSHN